MINFQQINQHFCSQYKANIANPYHTQIFNLPCRNIYFSINSSTKIYEYIIHPIRIQLYITSFVCNQTIYILNHPKVPFKQYLIHKSSKRFILIIYSYIHIPINEQYLSENQNVTSYFLSTTLFYLFFITNASKCLRIYFKARTPTPYV